MSIFTKLFAEIYRDYVTDGVPASGAKEPNKPDIRAWGLQAQDVLADIAGIVLPGGRLTLQSGTPVMTSSQAGKTSIFYAPYVGKWVPVYDGTDLLLRDFTASDTDAVGLTLVLGSNWAANSAFDVFATMNSGNVVLCTVPWTNTTTLATARAPFKGVLTNATSATARVSNSTTITLGANKGTYLGSFYTNGSTGTVDFIFGGSASGGTAASFGLWNQYNRVTINARVVDSGASYTYSSATVRQARGSAGNQVKYIAGAVEDSISAVYMQQVATAAVTGAYTNCGFGINTTSSYTFITTQTRAPTGASFIALNSGGCTYTPSLGVSVLSANEQGDGANSNTLDNASINALCFSFRM